MTRNANNNETKITSIIQSNDSMLNIEDSIEIEINKLRDILRQKASEVNNSNTDSVPDSMK